MASQYEPDLFTTILPTVWDAGTFVVALYVWTGYTDRAVTLEEKSHGREVADDTRKGAARYTSRRTCALALEEEFLSSAATGGSAEDEAKYSRVVWLVISDSRAVKEWVNETYGEGQDVGVAVPSQGSSSNSPKQKLTIPRHVMYTSSHGAHTKPLRCPSTSDFASAMIDWMLIGESDAVVTTGNIYSFGVTAALRTARPLYDATGTNEPCGSGGGKSECVS